MVNEWRLQCFVTTARCGSLRQAASRLHITQPALSRQVSTLEAELGAVLFERTTSGVELTAEGEAAFRSASDLLGRMGSFERMFRQVPSVSYTYFYSYNLSEIARRFKQRRPDVALMAKRRVSGGVTSAPGSAFLCLKEELAGLAGYAYRSLVKAGMCLVTAPDDALASLPAVSVGQIAEAGRPVVVITKGDHPDRVDSGRVQLEGMLKGTLVSEAPSFNDVLEMVRAGCAVSCFIMTPDMDAAGLAAVPVEGFEEMEVGLGYLQEAASPDVLALADVVEEVYRDKSVRPRLV